MRPASLISTTSIATVVALASMASDARATSPPQLDHVLVIVMENKSYDEVRTQPYTASLIAQGSSFSNSYAVTHPSQPNYLALWAGSTLGVTNDICPPAGSPWAVENFGHACEAAGLTWRAYSENLPAAGSPVCTATGTLYTRKHDPWTDFSNLDHSNERPYTDLAADEAGSTLPNLAFVIPNNCDNSHDSGCPVAFADAWLAANVPAMLDALGPSGMLVLTWDEDDFSTNNHILTVFVGPKVMQGYVSTGTINHYTVVRTLCETLGLAPFGSSSSQPVITDVWNDTTPATRYSWGRLKTIYR